MVFWRASPIFYKIPHPRAAASRDLSRRRERLFQRDSFVDCRSAGVIVLNGTQRVVLRYPVANTTGSPTRITPGARVQAKTPT